MYLPAGVSASQSGIITTDLTFFVALFWDVTSKTWDAVTFNAATAGIPLTSRRTWQTVATYLRSEGFTGSNNDVIMKWLVSEGHTQSYNDNWNNYLTAQGFLTGSLADKYAAWKKGD